MGRKLDGRVSFQYQEGATVHVRVWWPCRICAPVPKATCALWLGRTGPAINFGVHPKAVRSPNWATYRKLNSIGILRWKATGWPFFIAGLNRNW